MDVTKTNFDLATAEISALLPKAEFIAIDLEFSCITPVEEVLPTDTTIEYFYKMATIPTQYALFTCGISIFRPLDTGDSMKQYETHNYNFYLLPQKAMACSNKIMGFNTQAISFLNKHNTVDFDKWFKNGVPYIRSENLSTLTKDIHKKSMEETLKNLKETKEDAPYLSNTKLINYNLEEKERLLEWYTEDNTTPFRYLDIDATAKKAFLYDLSRMNEIDIGLLYLEEYKNEITHERYITITKQSKKETEDLYAKMREKLNDKIHKYMGFTKLWDILKDNIQAYRIPVVGHNLLVDLMYLYNHLERKIDRNFFTFREQVHSHIFPFIFDTKLIADHFSLGHLCLEDMWKSLKDNDSIKQKIAVKPATEIADGNFNAHNAAYDAYITGWAFMLMKKNMTDIDRYANKLKYRNSRYYDIGLTEKQICIAKNNKTLVFTCKYTDYSNVDINGEMKEGEIDNQLNELIKKLSAISTISGVSTTSHKFIDHIKTRKCYFVDFEGSLHMKTRKELLKDYNISDLKTHFDKVHNMFKTDVYKHKRKVNDL